MRPLHFIRTTWLAPYGEGNESNIIGRMVADTSRHHHPIPSLTEPLECYLCKVIKVAS